VACVSRVMGLSTRSKSSYSSAGLAIKAHREEQRESADAFAASGRSTCQTEQSPYIGSNHRSTEDTLCTLITNSSTRFARTHVIYTRM